MPGKSKLEETIEKVVTQMDEGKYRFRSNNSNYENLNYFVNHIITNQDETKK